MGLPLHSKIINQIARKSFKPIGVKRKGQSRIWIDDNKWWLVGVEFTPSRWSAGTGLMVGINWLWSPDKHLGFSITYDKPHVAFENEEQFTEATNSIVYEAKKRILYYRENFESPKNAAEFVLQNEVESKNHIWSCLNKALICIVSEINLADTFLIHVVECPDNRCWTIPVKEYASDLLKLGHEDRIEKIKQMIVLTRKANNLEDCLIEFW